MKNNLGRYVYNELPQKQTQERGTRNDMLITLGVLAVTILVTELLRMTSIENQNLMMVYFVAVIVVSRMTSGYVWGIVAALAFTLCFDFLITSPRFSSSLGIGYPITLLTMMLATLITSTLTLQVKTQAQIALDRERRAELMYEINQKLLTTRDLEATVHMTNEYLLSHLGRSVVFYTQDPFARDAETACYVAGDEVCADHFCTEAERKRVHRIFKSGGTDPSTIFDDERPDVHYEPITAKGNLLGLVGVYCGDSPLTPGSLSFLQAVCGQVALALELQFVSDRQSRTIVEAEKEKMRSTLLRAISHDLRTPLTSILGASSTILEQKEMDRRTVDGLVQDIRENTQWLIRMVENILTITKITKETMRVEKMPEAAEEVVSESVDIVRRRFTDWQIHVKVPDELLIVPMDATLIAQVVINLIENAVKNSPPGSLILVNLKREGDLARFDISDNGHGIHEELLDHLFEVHPPGQEKFVDSLRGIGIGLSICQAIVRAHGGTIEGGNRKEGGARFTFFLPLHEQGDPAPGDPAQGEAEA